MIQGIVFDLDGTLVDSQLDFDAMRREMCLPDGVPILEAVEKLAGPRAIECHEVLRRHEWEGAERAKLLPGVGEVLTAIEARGMRRAIATRNSRQIAHASLKKVGVRFELVFTRDDGPVKPNPWAVTEASRLWRIPADQIVIIGDFRFDIECGRAAGCRTVLLTHTSDPHTYPNEEQADLVLSSLAEHERLISWLDSL